MTYTVRFTPEAAEQLESLYRYIATASSSVVAAGYVDAIVTHARQFYIIGVFYGGQDYEALLTGSDDVG